MGRNSGSISFIVISILYPIDSLNKYFYFYSVGLSRDSNELCYWLDGVAEVDVVGYKTENRDHSA